MARPIGPPAADDRPGPAIPFSSNPTRVGNIVQYQGLHSFQSRTLNRDNAIAKVDVSDQLNVDAVGATVTGIWTLNSVPQGTFSGDTAANGRAKIVFTVPSPSPGDALRFCVDAIAHPSLAYDPLANVVDPPCVDGVWP